MFVLKCRKYVHPIHKSYAIPRKAKIVVICRIVAIPDRVSVYVPFVTIVLLRIVYEIYFSSIISASCVNSKIFCAKSLRHL